MKTLRFFLLLAGLAPALTFAQELRIAPTLGLSVSTISYSRRRIFSRYGAEPGFSSLPLSTHFFSMKTPALLSLFGALLLVTACGGPKADPLEEQLKKVWTAQTVRENNTLVYSRGGASNARNYTRYRLDLSNPPSAALTDWDGLTFIGQYELQGSTQLVLKNLTPQPTDTNGSIEFTINSASDTQLDLTRSTASPKTGGSSNQYVLTNP